MSLTCQPDIPGREALHHHHQVPFGGCTGEEDVGSVPGAVFVLLWSQGQNQWRKKLAGFVSPTVQCRCLVCRASPGGSVDFVVQDVLFRFSSMDVTVPGAGSTKFLAGKGLNELGVRCSVHVLSGRLESCE